MAIKFTPHAEDKLLRLKKIGVTKDDVVKIVDKPEKIVDGYLGRKIAQTELTNDLVVRVIYEEKAGDKIIVTL